MIEYLYAFKHVPLWFWALGAAGTIATVLVFFSDAGCFQKSYWRNRLGELSTRSFREYAGSTNGWIKKESIG
jgi:hypothetical protein